MSLDALLLCVSVIIAGFLYVSGPQLAQGGRAFAERVVASRGAGLRRPRRAHHPQRVARGDRRRGDPGAARRDRAGAGRHPGRGPARLRHAPPLHRADRAGAGAAAGADLGLDDARHRAGADPDGAPGADHDPRQRPEAAADGPRPAHADAGHPDRRHRRHDHPRAARPLPRPGGAVGALRAVVAWVRRAPPRRKRRWRRTRRSGHDPADAGSRHGGT